MISFIFFFLTQELRCGRLAYNLYIVEDKLELLILLLYLLDAGELNRHEPRHGVFCGARFKHREL